MFSQSAMSIVPTAVSGDGVLETLIAGGRLMLTFSMALLLSYVLIVVGGLVVASIRYHGGKGRKVSRTVAHAAPRPPKTPRHGGKGTPA